MRRIASLLMATLMVFGTTVVAYAFAPWPDKAIYYVQDGQSYIGELDTSSLSADQQDFLKRWKNSGDYLLGIFGGKLCFVEIYQPYTYYYMTDNGKHLVKLHFTNVPKGKPYLRVIEFDENTGHYRQDYTQISDGRSDEYLGGYQVFDGWFTLDHTVDSDCIIGYEGGLGIVDDGGIFADTLPTPPEPSEPDDPPPTPSYPDFPDIGPSDNKYVVYDTTTWNKFADDIKQAIGASTNVGFVILGTILSLYLVRRIVKSFAG